jgi:hypothetical protein
MAEDPLKELAAMPAAFRASENRQPQADDPESPAGEPFGREPQAIRLPAGGLELNIFMGV